MASALDIIKELHSIFIEHLDCGLLNFQLIPSLDVVRFKGELQDGAYFIGAVDKKSGQVAYEEYVTIEQYEEYEYDNIQDFKDLKAFKASIAPGAR